MMWPVADAFNNNFEATPPVISSKLKTAQAFSLTGSINRYLKSTWLNIFTPISNLITKSAANA